MSYCALDSADDFLKFVMSFIYPHVLSHHIIIFSEAQTLIRELHSNSIPFCLAFPPCTYRHVYLYPLYLSACNIERLPVEVFGEDHPLSLSF